MEGIRKAKTALKNAVVSNLLKNEYGNYVVNLENRLPIALFGPPGVGKTEITKQVAEELNIGFISYSMTQHTRSSIIGLPVIKELDYGGTYTEYTMSEIIAKVKEAEQKGEREGILLLDEFSCMSESVMPEMLSFLQIKRIGSYRLPEGWNIVICSNPRKYNNSSKPLDAAITDRIRIINIVADFEDFLEYSRENYMNKTVVDYLKFNRENFYRIEKQDQEIKTVTSRSWENLARSIDNYEKLGLAIDEEFINQFIKIDTIATGFYQYYTDSVKGINYSEMSRIINGEFTDDTVKIVDELTPFEQWRIVDNILKYVEDINSELLEDIAVKNVMWDTFGKKKANKKTRADNHLKEQMKEVSYELNNVFKFVGKLKAVNILFDRMYYYINSSNILLRAMCEKTCDEYLKLCNEKLRNAL